MAEHLPQTGWASVLLPADHFAVLRVHQARTLCWTGQAVGETLERRAWVLLQLRCVLLAVLASDLPCCSLGERVRLPCLEEIRRLGAEPAKGMPVLPRVGRLADEDLGVAMSSDLPCYSPGERVRLPSPEVLHLQGVEPAKEMPVLPRAGHLVDEEMLVDALPVVLPPSMMELLQSSEVCWEHLGV